MRLHFGAEYDIIYGMKFFSRMKSWTVGIVAGAALFVACEAAAGSVKRAYRAERYSRGNLGVMSVQEVDSAQWLWHPDLAKEVTEAPQRYLRFRKEFVSPGGVAKVDVSADERFVLMLDGEVVARGPNRGSGVENWMYQTYDMELEAGAHVLEAVVWRIGENAPLAQLSWRGGFILKAEGAFDELLTTGKAKWQVGELKGTEADWKLETACSWGGGSPVRVKGTGMLDEMPMEWKEAVVVRGAVPNTHYGSRAKGWLLYPSTLPDQLEVQCAPGSIKAGGVKVGEEWTIAANTKKEILWDLENYYCAYPMLETAGGKGAKVEWAWSEAMIVKNSTWWNPYNYKVMNRNEWEGKEFRGFTDEFWMDGREKAVFTTPWWRCGRWVKLTIQTKDEPLKIRKASIIESRYPLKDESEFVCSDASLVGVRKICERAMQMCAHEMLFDCPFYEQQMYPGDTRVQLRILAAMSGDDRLIRRAAEVYDYARRDNGMVPMNWPTRGLQEGVTYSMCQLMMYGDYARENGNKEWLAARLPGMRHTLDGISYLEDADGILKDLPGWSFMDWVAGWGGGVAPDGEGPSPSAVNNLYWVLTLKNAAYVERAMGNEAMAAIWEKKAAKTMAAVEKLFWDEGRGMYADTVKHNSYSEHAQCLALLADVLDEAKAKRVFEGLVSAADLSRCTVYFSYYLFDAYFKFGRGDLFLKRLDLWRDYVARGLRTTLEEPETEAKTSRSDCHAWGAHPLVFMQRGLAGLQSAAPFFEKVRVAPSPGSLTFIRAKTPHPKGFVEVELKFDGPKVSGFVTLPKGIRGEFVWKGRTIPLAAGKNNLIIGD